ncbi:MAG: phosphoenolpyruvate carboxykinase (ATP) [Flammeovirgaceae bacterium]|nr:phosphoenolpyruvate carboxykinase (ATP) [Flammeovirgaceae bacterium]
MRQDGIRSKISDLYSIGIKSAKVHWNYTPAELYEEIMRRDEGMMTDTGAVMVDTSAFTGRAPKDKYVVKDEKSENTVWWGEINQAISPETFDEIYDEMIKYLYNKELYVREGYAGADPKYQLKVRFVNTQAWQNLFCFNMFINPNREELESFTPEFTVIDAPEFIVDPKRFGIRHSNFALVNLTKNIILVGGSGYAGEIKKGIFSVMNYHLPEDKGVLSMHCSANIGEKGDTAVFFGLSGTGKTTLSADPNRKLIGDDEHGWTDTSVFNFEGGCYAKVVNLSREKEPEIWDAIKFGAILENTRFHEGTRTVNFEDTRVTENTRVSYPLDHIDNAAEPSIGDVPKNIFFLTCDAYGVLPPISKLDPGQAMFHFISGYTAKVAGTEMGITEPQATFSACFGAAFLPLHPTKYAKILGDKMKNTDVNVWLVNTGWTGGAHGVGSRMKLKYTRAMITAALEGQLENVEYVKHDIFGVQMPTECPGVPSELLLPINTWEDKAEYNKMANLLSNKFNKNFEKYSDFADEEILSGAPKSNETLEKA